VPETANENTGFFHLDIKIPEQYKYSLHNLFIRHGRMCKHCKGGPELKNRKKSSPKMIKEEVNADGNPLKIKRTKKVWTGNGLMKQIIIEVDTEDEGGELENEECVLEGLVKRIRKPRKDANS
jgi:hypothetical protein